MSKEEVATITKKRYQRPRNYWEQVIGQVPVVLQERDVVATASVATTATTVSTAHTTAPPADSPGGDAL